MHTQWRRQTIKSGSAFKGQLYFQVGQIDGGTEGPEAREARSIGAPRWTVEHGEGRTP